MYDSLEVNIRDRYLAVIIEPLGEEVRSKLYLYLLIYSILSANIYAELDCDGDHYRWCTANWKNPAYWQI